MSGVLMEVTLGDALVWISLSATAVIIVCFIAGKFND